MQLLHLNICIYMMLPEKQGFWPLDTKRPGVGDVRFQLVMAQGLG